MHNGYNYVITCNSRLHVHVLYMCIFWLGYPGSACTVYMYHNHYIGIHTCSIYMYMYMYVYMYTGGVPPLSHAWGHPLLHAWGHPFSHAWGHPLITCMGTCSLITCMGTRPLITCMGAPPYHMHGGTPLSHAWGHPHPSSCSCKNVQCVTVLHVLSY